MFIGFLSNGFGKGQSLEDIIRWAGDAGLRGIEIGQMHVDATKMAGAYGKELRKRLDDAGVKPTAFSLMQGSPQGAAHFAFVDETVRLWIPAAATLGIDTISTFAGFPAEGKSKLETIRDMAPDIFGPLAELCAEAGIRLAFENWTATNLQEKDHFRALLEVLPQDNVGLNFDPSHLVVQGIDPLSVLDLARDRIFHSHAKDTLVYGYDKEGATWHYVTPGYGDVGWGRYIRGLRAAGYDGVLSIEHEDPVFSPEEALTRANRFLSVLVQ